MGNYAQEASGYGPQRVNYNNAAGYNQPAGQGQNCLTECYQCTRARVCPY